MRYCSTSFDDKQRNCDSDRSGIGIRAFTCVGQRRLQNRRFDYGKFTFLVRNHFTYNYNCRNFGKFILLGYDRCDRNNKRIRYKILASAFHRFFICKFFTMLKHGNAWRRTYSACNDYYGGRCDIQYSFRSDTYAQYGRIRNRRRCNCNGTCRNFTGDIHTALLYEKK